jgi:hypothetical protein
MVRPIHRNNLEWAKTHADFRDGRFLCRVTGNQLATVHVEVRVWEDPSVNNRTPSEVLNSGRHIEPTLIDHLCCHDCGEGEQMSLRVLYSELVWDLQDDGL